MRNGKDEPQRDDSRLPLHTLAVAPPVAPKPAHYKPNVERNRFFNNLLCSVGLKLGVGSNSVFGPHHFQPDKAKLTNSGNAGNENCRWVVTLVVFRNDSFVRREMVAGYGAVCAPLGVHRLRRNFGIKPKLQKEYVTGDRIDGVVLVRQKMLACRGMI